MTLHSGATHRGDWRGPKWDATDPPTAEDLEQKFFAYVEPHLSFDQAKALHHSIRSIDTQGCDAFLNAVTQPILS